MTMGRTFYSSILRFFYYYLWFTIKNKSMDGYLAGHSNFLSGRLKGKLYLYQKSIKLPGSLWNPKSKVLLACRGPLLQQGPRCLWLWVRCESNEPHNWDQVHSLRYRCIYRCMAQGLNSQIRYGSGVSGHSGTPLYTPVALSQFNHEGVPRKESLPLSPHYNHDFLIAVHHCAVLA